MKLNVVQIKRFSLKGKQHCGESRKYVTGILSFSHGIFKSCHAQVHENSRLHAEVQTVSLRFQISTALRKTPFENIV